MITKPSAQPRNYFILSYSKVLGLILLTALFVTVLNPTYTKGTAQAATLQTTSQKDGSSGQQWPAGLWQAYQAVHPLTISGSFTLSSELTATDNAANDQFGREVWLSSDGSTALIGAPNHTVNGHTNAGAAYIFIKNGNVWSQAAELTASDAGASDVFGTPVSISSDGSVAVVGAPYHTVNGKSSAGAAYIFTKGGSGWVTSTQTAELTASDGAFNDSFGSGVRISRDGSTALVNSYIHTVNGNYGAGAVYIFTKGGSGWVTSTQTAELTASDGATGDNLGSGLSLSSDGSVAVAGAYHHTVNGNSQAGAAYIFTKGGSGWITSTQSAELTASDGVANDNFGISEDLSGDNSTLLVGAFGKTVNGHSSTGSAYVFTKGGSGWITSTQSAELTASDGAANDQLGITLSLSGDSSTALIGAPHHSVNGISSAGAAYVFTKGGSGWVTSTQTTQITATDGTTNDNFGVYLTLSDAGSIALIGALNHAVNGHSQAGAAYIFKAPVATSTTINSSPNPSTYGQPITFTANVSPTTATGTVTFDLDNSPVYTATLVGSTDVATYVTNTLTPGVYTATATYSGDSNDAASTSNVLTQTVNPANSVTTLTSAPNSSLISQTVVFTASVSGTGPTPPSGTVTFTNVTTNQTLGTATLSVSGIATATTTFSTTGSYTITATYSGDSNYTSSNASITQQVVTLPPTIAVNAGNGQSTPISTTFPIALQAIVRDGSTGKPLPGVTVVFQAPTSGASGFFSPTNSTTFTATTDANGLATANAFTANGTVGSYQVTASTAGAASPATFNLVNSPVNTASGYTYYLPFLANNANNFTTYLVFQNTANVSSTVSISFYDNNGNAVAPASNTCTSVAALGECIVPNPFASGKQGEGIIVSQQPLNVIVSEATPYGGSAYAVAAGASNNLIAPVAIHNGLVDFTTQLSIFNGGSSAVTGTVQFFDQNGGHITAADKSFTLAAHSTTIYDQSQDNTLSNFYGWAEITSPAGSQLVAQTLEQRPSVKFVAIVNAQFNPQTTLYAPAIFNGAFGNFVTGANLVNPNSQPVTVTITYYKNDGTTSTTSPFVIPANAVTGIFQGASSGNGLPSGGLPNNWYGAATVKATGGGIIMFVNEQGGLTATGSDQSGTYGAAVSGSSTVGLPVMANGAFGGYITGATIENITSSPVTATVQYYDLSGNAVGTAKTVTIGGNASYGLYQGGSDQALPSGFYGTAQITVTGGSSSSLLVTTNAQSNVFFYSYTEPNF